MSPVHLSAIQQHAEERYLVVGVRVDVMSSFCSHVQLVPGLQLVYTAVAQRLHAGRRRCGPIYREQRLFLSLARSFHAHQCRLLNSAPHHAREILVPVK